MNKKILIILLAVFFMLIASACSEKYDLKTPIGNFDMTAEITDTYENTAPQDGNQFLVVHLAPQQSGITPDQMRQYIFPTEQNTGIIAECQAGEYTLTALKFEPGKNGQDCVIIFEVPKDLTDTAGIRLKIPTEEPQPT